MSDRDVMKMALNALEAMNPYPASKGDQRACAIAFLRARLAEPETCKPALQVAEPVLSARGADARRGRWLLDKMRHQNCGPYSGWTLVSIYPGDDAAAAIDAAMDKERGDE